jgi:acyl-CoA hydrolase
MPRVFGDGFIHVDEVDFLIPYDEPLLEYRARADTEIARKIGNYVSRLIQDGDTIQVGYGSLPNAILESLTEKKHLGVHTELLSDGIVALLEQKVIDNSQKRVNSGKTVATLCMGTRKTYDYIRDNDAIEFKTIGLYQRSPGDRSAR